MPAGCWSGCVWKVHVGIANCDGRSDVGEVIGDSCSPIGIEDCVPIIGGVTGPTWQGPRPILLRPLEARIIEGELHFVGNWYY